MKVKETKEEEARRATSMNDKPKSIKKDRSDKKSENSRGSQKRKEENR